MTQIYELPTDSIDPYAHSDSKNLKIFAGRLFDPQTLEFHSAQAITIAQSSGLILNVEPISYEDIRALEQGSAAEQNRIIDLRHLTVLPGFVDVHVHFFLHSYAETSWNDQTTKESLVERTVRATVHARKTLMAGFTTVRDLGTEGADDADLVLRKCLSGPNALIPGPRYFCANRAIVSTGSYGPKSSLRLNEEGVEGVTGAEVADGVDGCIQATRRQIGAGADWIKIYADYRVRSRMSDVSSRVAAQAIPTFNTNELSAMIETAHNCGVKVAAHASSYTAIRNLLTLGVDTIEHGVDNIPHDDDLLQLLATSKTVWVPTLAVYYKLKEFASGKDAGLNARWDNACSMFKKAIESGMDNIACGGDTGAFSHGENTLEMKLMVRLGADWRKVLKWATLGGWECIRPVDWEKAVKTVAAGDNDVRFGCAEAGWAADLIGVEGDLEQDFEATVDCVQFVMKRGKVYKRDGKEIPV